MRERRRQLLAHVDRALELGIELLERVLGTPSPDAFFENTLAFRWDDTVGRGRLVRIADPARFALDDLLGVEKSVATLDRNIRQFIAGLPYNDVLLYGERGTGKSSSVRGLLDRYADAGLRIVEVDRGQLVALPAVLSALPRASSLHFVIFCDDLSFGSNEGGYRELKAALEGSLEATPDNVCIIATSNRRHLVSETMAENRAARVDAEGELHHGEALEEKLALSDRFGLSLGFYNFDQPTYLAIVAQYLGQAGMADRFEALRPEALRWALARGTRSGRTARQFVDDAVGRIRLG
jgi:predicted AAA+ superfamily ATPase